MPFSTNVFSFWNPYEVYQVWVMIVRSETEFLSDETKPSLSHQNCNWVSLEFELWKLCPSPSLCRWDSVKFESPNLSSKTQINKIAIESVSCVPVQTFCWWEWLSQVNYLNWVRLKSESGTWALQHLRNQPCGDRVKSTQGSRGLPVWGNRFKLSSMMTTLSTADWKLDAPVGWRSWCPPEVDKNSIKKEYKKRIISELRLWC